MLAWFLIDFNSQNAVNIYILESEHLKKSGIGVCDLYAFRANLPHLCSKCTPVAHERVEEATSQNRRSSPRTSPRIFEQNILDALAFGRVCGLCMTRSILARPVPFPSEACLPGRAGAAQMAQRGALRVLCVHCGVCRCMPIMMTCV